MRARTFPDRARRHRDAPAFAVVAFILALSVSGCRVAARLSGGSSTGAEKSGRQSRKWTVLVYLNGDNELEPQAIRSLNQMEAVDLRGTGISLLALLDRAPGFDTSNGDWTATRLFEVRADPEGENGVIVSLPLASPELGLDREADSELDMGDPETLRRFLEFAEKSYPSEHRALIIWGHGSGWRSAGTKSPEAVSPVPAALGRSAAPPPVATVRAVSFDDSSGPNPLYTKELGDVLSECRVDVCGFDCCSEAMIEVGYELRAGADYMVASEDVIRSDGWNYSKLLRQFVASEKTPAALAASMVDSFADEQSNTAGATISALRLAALDEVAAALDDFSDLLSSCIDDASTQAFIRSLLFEEVEDFYSIPGDLNLDVADMAVVAERNLPALGEAAFELERAVSSAVLAEWHHPSGHPNAHGLAIHYVPLGGDGTAETHADAYFQNVPTEYPLSFVQTSTWVPRYPSGPGLLYRIWYEVF